MGKIIMKYWIFSLLLFLFGCASMSHYGSYYEFNPASPHLKHFEVVDAKGQAYPMDNQLIISYNLRAKTLRDGITVKDVDYCVTVEELYVDYLKKMMMDGMLMLAMNCTMKKEIS
ncbi:hypothetical protein [Vibrio fluvialis]|uniref:hypothetical protein n=1 Tax=Vibrio fluvialis TaxID=676 RepID=UPI001EEC9717|nr:hypothetical protein [Vibrio fluvialis]MCG6414370.1 hypothetical protein [Vibrio fluvialis]